jgi:membrane-bound ClpP family serine protease
MKKLTPENVSHWLPRVVGGIFVLLAGRIIFVGLTSPHASLGTAAWPSAVLLVLAFGLFRRANWARWIAAVGLFLAGVFCFALLVSRFFPPGIFGRDGATNFVERPSLAMTIVWLLPPSLLLPAIAHLLRPVRKA